ncbi:hypothetical protein T484DRAFT_1940877 [Baffinella frigidus]|nr:hypothetical protein T484DRAFT_1940877 [Cryptophyta sp. CCMP2293]
MSASASATWPDALVLSSFFAPSFSAISVNVETAAVSFSIARSCCPDSFRVLLERVKSNSRDRAFPNPAGSC